MRTVILCLLGLGSAAVSAQNSLTSVEYFIGDDPGLGNATALAVGASPSISTSFTIPLVGLSEGIHTLHVRAKSDEDKWTLYARKPFYIYSSFQTEPITAAEYFLGPDPGLGNGTPISIDPGASVQTSFAIPIEDLDDGLHVLKVRVKDADQKWSVTSRRIFLVSTSSTQNIVAAEYFIGDDPGLGNATALEVTTGNTLSTVWNIDLPDLDPYALYMLHIRVKDNREKWSLYASKTFFTVQNPVDLNITAAEYFIDEDPGIGAANPIDVPSLAVLDEMVFIDVPASLPDGFHFLHIRVKNENEKWSTYARREFESGEGLNTVESGYHLNIYPNPTRDRLQVTYENITLERLRLIDAHGQVLLDEVQPVNQIDLSSFADGMYILHVFTSEGAFSHKVVKN